MYFFAKQRPLLASTCDCANALKKNWQSNILVYENWCSHISTKTCRNLFSLNALPHTNDSNSVFRKSFTQNGPIVLYYNGALLNILFWFQIHFLLKNLLQDFRRRFSMRSFVVLDNFCKKIDINISSFRNFSLQFSEYSFTFCNICLIAEKQYEKQPLKLCIKLLFLYTLGGIKMTNSTSSKC